LAETNKHHKCLFFALLSPKQTIIAKNALSLQYENLLMPQNNSNPNVHTLKNLTMNTLFLFSMPGGGELILLMFVVLLLFGGRKIPELARGLGRGIREFNDAKSSIQRELEDGIDEKKK
jgi:sec-independent protein translocase protein TatA